MCFRVLRLVCSAEVPASPAELVSIVRAVSRSLRLIVASSVTILATPLSVYVVGLTQETALAEVPLHVSIAVTVVTCEARPEDETQVPVVLSSLVVLFDSATARSTVYLDAAFGP